MPKITKPQTMIDVDATWDHPKRVRLTFKKDMYEVSNNADLVVKLDKKQTTQLINVLKSQRKRKALK
jgi:hypothetical protein